MRFIILPFMFFLWPIISYTQPSYDAKRDYVWIMGYTYSSQDTVDHIFLDFSYDSLQLNPYRASNGHSLFQTNASVCDTAGKFLFYSNGCVLVDSAFQYIVGADTINQGIKWENYCFRSATPWASPTDGYVIVNGCWILPVSDRKYKVFYADIVQNIGHTSGIRFSTVRQEGVNHELRGYGVDTYLYEEDLHPNIRGVVRHANGRDWWMVNEAYADKWYYISYIDSTDTVHPTKERYFDELQEKSYHGGSQGVFSPDGTVYATTSSLNQCQVFDFDRCEGELSNPRTITFPLPYDSIIGVTGIAISPNSRYMYLMLRKSIWQYDLYHSDIQSTATRVADYDGFRVNNFSLNFYQSQLGPDGKIYVFNSAARSMIHVIEYPDSAGTACHVNQHKYVFEEWGAVAQPPRFPNYRLGPLAGSPCDTIDWTTSSTQHKPHKSPEESLSLRPNPARDHFVADISLSDYRADRRLSIEVVDALGRVVRREAVPPYSSLRRVEVGDLERGFYMVRLMSRGRVLAVRKLVVQRE